MTTVIQDAVCEFIMNRLPQGSGINSSWWARYKNGGKVYHFYNSYSYIDENGMHLSDQNICLTVDRTTWDWKLKFLTPRREHIIDQIKEYIEDILTFEMKLIEDQFVELMEMEP